MVDSFLPRSQHTNLKILDISFIIVMAYDLGGTSSMFVNLIKKKLLSQTLTSAVFKGSFTYRSNSFRLFKLSMVVVISAAIAAVPSTVIAATINGTSGNDTLRGTSSADTIKGFGADDTIYGYEGDDYLYGGRGDDVIYGSYGRDHIYGWYHSNYLDGGSGSDTIYASGNVLDDSTIGFNQIFGRGGSDTITVTQTEAKIYGGDGNDKISAVADSGTLSQRFLIYGEQDDDYIKVVDTPATVYGGSGNDEIHGGGETSHLLYGGSGHDKLYMETDIGGTIYGNSGNDYLWTFDSGRLNGGSGNDVLEADNGADMTGGDGADRFICSGGEENILDYDPAEGDVLVNQSLCDSVT